MRILTICPKCNVAYKGEDCPKCHRKDDNFYDVAKRIDEILDNDKTPSSNRK